jgi:hypothetical protein
LLTLQSKILLLLDCLLWHDAISMPSVLWWLPIFLLINTTHEQEMLDKEWGERLENLKYC